ncbi:hypothetical protein FBEOM_2085 [Fusarium beomiforme]|uniref:Uncharacterized protein n=1 Tax=Fusarium beomiforme TaxID=44412 RepID=A0A9P5E402_9HYPO|nr:hypothetical protein FBEOM_2085 [Fusarium beomiforme]
MKPSTILLAMANTALAGNLPRFVRNADLAFVPIRLMRIATKTRTAILPVRRTGNATPTIAKEEDATIAAILTIQARPHHHSSLQEHNAPDSAINAVNLSVEDWGGNGPFPVEQPSA